MFNFKYLIAFTFVISLISCGDTKQDETNDTAIDKNFKASMSFSKLDKEETGIDFKNVIIESDSFNFFNFEYIYNGGGVAIGDINNDGLKDIYLTGNQISDKVYLNKGDMKFEDITKTAIGDWATNGWHTGVTMADVNQDGWVDIYVSRSGKNKALLGNLLFINNQDNTFSEKSQEFGVDVRRMTTQSAFFDFDNDGDLDLYVMNHPIQDNSSKPKKTVDEVKALIEAGSPDSDVLLENIGDNKFVDISLKAGVKNHSYGLGIAISDINKDGFLDVFVTNDYMAPDNLFINNGDGTFTDKILEQFKHISNFAMGNDISDFNNDGLPDVLSVDMASEDHVRSKKNMGGMSSEKFWGVVVVGFHYQYMFNTLQLNNGDGSFSDVAQSMGIAKTDWSWAPLFIDFDNDGHKDLFISNGYRRDSRDNDYIRNGDRREDIGFQEKLDLMPTTKIQNYIYRNTGDYHFDKKIKEWKIDFPVNTNGTSFADLDNDGDIDLVLNNSDEESFILRNDLKTKNNHIRINLVGPNQSLGLGAKVQIKTENGIQYQELQVTRGYISSVEDILHFGLGELDKIEEIRVDWLDGKSNILSNVKPNQVLNIDHAKSKKIEKSTDVQPKLLTNISDQMTTIESKEYVVNDFKKEVLLPNKMSQLGPFMSSGDVNGDGLDDFYLSGSRRYAGRLFIQNEKGDFTVKKGPWIKEIEREELESEMLDIDNDGDLDLYVVSGGNEYDVSSELLYDQLYINDGKGNFTNETEARVPPMMTSGQSITSGDIDNDGDLDLFLGGRQTPGAYPYPPRSFVLLNEGGVFQDVSDKSKDLLGPGMITDALFDDFDQDGDLDLVCVGEWMPIMFFENDKGAFSNVTLRMGDESEVGWWYSIAKGDFNGDGKNDYIVGNLGNNNKFHPSKKNPLEIYFNDFDNSGTFDIVLAKYQNNVCYPVRGKQCSTEQMPFIARKFPTYAEFAEADITKLYGEDKIKASLNYSATTFKSVIMLSQNGKYKSQNLPSVAQFSPINDSKVLDINGDGHLDVISVGNNHSAEVETIRYDAGTGLILLGDGNGNFQQKRGIETGLYADGDVKDMIMMKIGNKNCIVISANNSNIKWFSIN